jgi:predicted alpha/beta-hydrolase family hydrolase
MARPAGLLLFHGAGGNRDHRLFVRLEAELPLPVRRINFAYRDLGPRRPPPRADKLVDEVVAAAEDLASELDVPTRRIVLGGRSMGGRVASLAVAGGLPARALLLLSYPLHPPGKPERTRTEHFPDIGSRCLFVAGDRDPFGSPDEVEAGIEAIPGKVETVWLPGDGHDPKKNDDLLVGSVARWLRSLR